MPALYMYLSALHGGTTGCLQALGMASWTLELLVLWRVCEPSKAAKLTWIISGNIAAVIMWRRCPLQTKFFWSMYDQRLTGRSSAHSKVAGRWHVLQRSLFLWIGRQHWSNSGLTPGGRMPPQASSGARHAARLLRAHCLLLEFRASTQRAVGC